MRRHRRHWQAAHAVLVRPFDALVGALDRLDTAGLEAAAADVLVAPLDKASAHAYDVYAKEFRQALAESLEEGDQDEEEENDDD
jgi:hypothetical protein